MSSTTQDLSRREVLKALVKELKQKRRALDEEIVDLLEQIKQIEDSLGR